MHTIDLNSDLGESFGRYTLGLDDQIIPLVSSVNIACGQHAGDPLVMKRTLRLAAQSGVALGAHPGYPDLQGFGRRDMGLSPEEGYAYVLYQIGALAAFAQAEGARLAHVKPHGQLYNRAAVDGAFAEAIARAVYDFDPQLILVGLANGKLIDAGRALGLCVAQEFFLDRNYTDEGVLAPRNLPHALITDETLALSRLIQVIKTGTVESISGKTIEIRADTVCVHGDNTHALAFVQQAHHVLNEHGISIQALSLS